MKHHAEKLFPIALQELIEIGEKARKQREKEERAKHVVRKEKQAKQLQLQLQTRI